MRVKLATVISSSESISKVPEVPQEEKLPEKAEPTNQAMEEQLDRMRESVKKAEQQKIDEQRRLFDLE